MRIFDPKDQLGNSLLSSADTQKSSVKLEKQMAVGGGAITLSSADISDIENWELCNASVMVDGKAVNFLPETSKDEYGNITVVFGRYFENVVLVLKRVEFGAMCEQEQLTIEVKIRRFMGQTMAAATAPTKRDEDEVQDNIDKWKTLGDEAYRNDPEGKYKNATRDSFSGYKISGTGEVVVDDCLISVDTFVDESWQGMEIDPDVTGIKWHADLPCLRATNSGDAHFSLITEWTGKIPNITTALMMFDGCSGLTSWTVELPNSLTSAQSMFSGCTGLTSFTTPSGSLPNSLIDASYMFRGCSGLTSWTVALPNSLIDARHMFDGCSGLTSWNGTLGNSLTDAMCMFNRCTGLKSWTVELPNTITVAGGDFQDYGMFYGCSGLREFTPSLAGLTNCTNFGGMFSGCILNEASIRNILGTLPNRTGKIELIIHIGGDKTMEQSVKDDLSSLAQSVSTAKNWNIVLQWNTPPTE